MLSFDNPTSADETGDLLFIFANQHVLLTQPRLIRRFDRGADRYYYVVDTETGVATFYVSTTSFIKKVLPTSGFLIEWFKKQGDQADVIRDQRADYGSLMHVAFADFHEQGYDFRKTRDRVGETITRLGHPVRLIGEWTDQLNKAVLSYAQFCNDWKVEPVLIEGMLASDELGIAGTLDNVCYMTNPKTGETKLSQVDFKSGGIFQSAELQLVINKLIFEENFPHLEIDALYSWSPKDWRDAPTYTLKNQNKTVFNPGVLDSFLHIYRTLYGEDVSTKTFHEFYGSLSPNMDTDACHRVLTMQEVIQQKY